MHVLQRSAQNNAGVIEHVLPQDTTLDDVELSIVIPAMNEEITVGEFMEWCKEGLQRAGVSGQILIVDSSTDNTPTIVLEHGGEVFRTPKRGVGRAYLDCNSLHPRKMDLNGRRRLDLRFSRDRSVRGGISKRRGVHHGQPVSRQHRKGRDAEIAPLLRHASDELDSQPDLSQQLFRHSLRDTRRDS